MKCNTRIAVIVLWAILEFAHCEVDFCDDGYQIARKYTECWEQSTMANRRTDLSGRREVYTAQFVEDYARHMCSVVKPQAIDCLTAEVANCSNVQKIIEMADNSGGTCIHNDLNEFFKLHIIDHLAPVRSDSECLTIADTSNCYNNAARRVKDKVVPISKFHYEADKFFASIWNCQIKLYKSKSDICKNWQLPMLLSLQNMAMPTLFGMKLTMEHVAMLELEDVVPNLRTTASPDKQEDKNKYYILLKVLTQKPEASDGEFVLQVNVGGDSGDDRNSIRISSLPEKKKKEKPNKTWKGKKDKAGKKDSDSQMIN